MTKEPRKKTKVKIFTNKQKQFKPEIEYIQELQAKYNDKIDVSKIKSFKDFPLSSKTLKGLKDASYKVPTEIQRETIMLALRGNDILGAAQTGSGKTLAFLIPMLEKLFCKQWTHLDKLGALIITPTRELALQIFETLRKIGVNHDFSCGLIIGGKDLKFERKRVDQCNIIICTPGRLLQHMDENQLFDPSNLQMLILDEADRCLDMGFKATMNAIIENLPLVRQTLLFSATQTKSVKDLARLNLKDPSYIAVHEKKAHSTPDGLEQSYVVCELKDKVSILWSFIKNHLKKKCIVFLSTCKQVKFIFEIFSKMRPGVPLMALYGRMHQLKRIKVYEEFSRKSAVILFATDIVARGLDFPEVDWVVQVDCPEDADTYIHRVGRTARFHKGGESLLLLMPSELKMLEDLEKKKIPISKIAIDPSKINDPFRKIESYISVDTALQYTAKRAFVTYLKSIYKMRKRSDIFNIEALDYDSFAQSLGLSVTPRLRFLKGSEVVQNKIVPTNPNKIVFDDDGNPTCGNKLKNQSSDDDEESDKEFNTEPKDKVKNSKKAGKRNDGDDFDSQLVDIMDVPDGLPEDVNLKDYEIIKKQKKPTTKAALVKKQIHEGSVTNKKIKFDEEGDPIDKGTKIGAIDGLDKVALDKEEDQVDKKLYKEKMKAVRMEQKKKLKADKKREREGEVDDFGESDSGDDVDLSWLPDPDKVYGKKKEDEEDEAEDSNEEEDRNEDDSDGGEDSDEVDDSDVVDSSGEEESNEDSESEEEEIEEKSTVFKSKKRKLEESKETPKKKIKIENLDELKETKKKHKTKNNIQESTANETKKKHKKMDKIKGLTSDLTVNEAEELALMLLQNK